jgi:predicted O-linked N-acetylglucosamine transferase (SPINDLY family)
MAPFLDPTDPRWNDPAALERLAAEYHRHGQLLPALKLYDRLIDLGAATDATWCAAGSGLTDLGEYAQAIGAYEQSLQRNPDNLEAHHDLARALYRMGDVDRAAEHLERAAALTDLLHPWQSLAIIAPGCPRATPERILEVRQTFARRLMDQIGASVPPHRPAHTNPDDRLRVGYLSAHFHLPHYMKPVWGLLNHHNRQAYEIHLFSDSPADAGLPGYVRHPSDRVHATADLSNEELAEAIRASGVQILVDLSAYSVPARLPLFTHHVAPVTIAWFNAFATSGLPGIDYLVGDDQVVYDGEERFFTEDILRLPMSYLTFEVAHPVPPVAPPPCSEHRSLTFGSLVSQYKITPPVLDAWAEILRRTDGTRLLLANTALRSIHNRQYVLDRFTERGIDADRVLLEGPADHYAFLQKYDRIDVALDAFPYNGGTTTMEAIWQGVPVLTFAGDRWASRTSPSLLHDTHLAAFVAKDVRDYVERATQLAQDSTTPRMLAELRRQMRDVLQNSTVCNTRELAQAMERLCWTAWNSRGRNRA